MFLLQKCPAARKPLLPNLYPTVDAFLVSVGCDGFPSNLQAELNASLCFPSPSKRKIFGIVAERKEKNHTTKTSQKKRSPSTVVSEPQRKEVSLFSQEGARRCSNCES